MVPGVKLSPDEVAGGRVVTPRHLRRWMTLTSALLLVAIAGGCARCGNASPHGDAKAVVDAPDGVELNDPLLITLDATARERIERHLRSSPRWEVREERGRVYATRRQTNGGACSECELPGGFRTSGGGFYSDYRGQVLMQTRVLLGLRGEPPEANATPLTVAKAGSGKTSVKTTAPRTAADATPDGDYTSWLRVMGTDGLYLEVMEQSRAPERRFTRSALVQVHGELARVLENAEVLEEEGYVPALWPDASPPRGEPRMEVHDGVQPGIYVVTAWVNPREKGRAFVRVFHDETKPLPKEGKAKEQITTPGQQLSEERIRDRSVEFIGWSGEGDVLFPYQSELTVYEGDWHEPYDARFELRFVNEQGEERTLVTTSRGIEGWMR